MTPSVLTLKPERTQVDPDSVRARLRLGPLGGVRVRLGHVEAAVRLKERRTRSEMRHSRPVRVVTVDGGELGQRGQQRIVQSDVLVRRRALALAGAALRSELCEVPPLMNLIMPPCEVCAAPSRTAE